MAPGLFCIVEERSRHIDISLYCQSQITSTCFHQRDIHSTGRSFFPHLPRCEVVCKRRMPRIIIQGSFELQLELARLSCALTGRRRSNGRENEWIARSTNTTICHLEIRTQRVKRQEGELLAQINSYICIEFKVYINI